MQNTAKYYNQPNDYDCLELISYKTKNFFDNYINPSLIFNTNMEIFCKETKCPKGDKVYVNFVELITSIMNTKFHNDNKMNELIQIKAIDYIINEDSLIHNFIDEIYKLKNDKIKTLNKKREVTDTFVIKVDEKGGKKYGSGDIKELKNVIEENNRAKMDLLMYSKIKKLKLISNMKKANKKVKYKLKINSNKSSRNKISQNKNSLFYSTYVDNYFKRVNIPSISYKGHIPGLIFSIGKTKKKVIDEAFLNAFFVKTKEKENFFNNFEEKVKLKGKKFKEPNNEILVNIFDLMFSVKSVSRNEIVLCKNNVNNIISQYSDDNLLIPALNYAFPPKTKKDVVVPWDMIVKYVNENQ